MKKRTFDITQIASIEDRQKKANSEPTASETKSVAKVPIAQQVNRVLSATEQRNIERNLTEDGRLIIEVDPRVIRLSRYANRWETAFHDDDYHALKESIRIHKQDDPIEIRPISGDPEFQYEVEAGSRRHRACLELGIPVLALVHTHASDRDLVLRMYRENHERRDMSAVEEAFWHVTMVLPEVFGGDTETYLAEFKRSKGWLSRCKSIAEIPREILDLFPDPRLLSFDEAYELGKHLKDEKVLAFIVRRLDELRDRGLNDKKKILSELLKQLPGPKSTAEKTQLDERAHKDQTNGVYVRRAKEKKSEIFRFRSGMNPQFVDFIWEQLPRMYADWHKENE